MVELTRLAFPPDDGRVTRTIEPRASALIAACFAASLAACSSETTPPAGPSEVERTEKDAFGLITCSPATPERTCYTHRTIIGVSMGAHGAGQLGFLRPELFDAVGMLGVPLVDWTYMLRNIQRGYVGGFCDRETILAKLDAVNDPDGGTFCGPVAGTEKFDPAGKIMEPAQDFNHWYRWIDAGRGGNFGRNKLRESFQDISLAFGNALYHNPASPYFPPGVPNDFRRRPDAERCANPVVIRGLKHKEYNPDGTHDVIAFCDTNTNTGNFDPAKPADIAFEMLLAVDYNKNGRRDYAEPVLVMAHERYEDVGRGPNDRYDPHTNPLGQAGNWIHDEGEPYEDTGLDGVPGTGDFGEGNGRFDLSPNAQRYMDVNPRGLLEKMPEGHLERMNIWLDAGLRDFLMSAGASNWLFGALQARVGKGLAQDYVDFPALLPGAVDFDFLKVDYRPEGVGRHVYVRYGNPDATEGDVRDGDGNHVGPPQQILTRFLTPMTFFQSRFHDRDVGAVELVNNLEELIRPRTFFSKSLDDMRKYGVVLPPGYEDPANANRRYPVLYFLHGQGQESDDLLASAILFFGYMAGSNQEDLKRKNEADWAKFIIVFPDSTCREGDCGSGNFNSNHPGIDGNGPKFMDSLLDLMAHIDANYRTAIPVEVAK